MYLVICSYTYSYTYVTINKKRGQEFEIEKRKIHRKVWREEMER